jgi:N-acetylneuraminic acid mutarotase
MGLSMRGSAAAILVLVFLTASSAIAFTPVSAAYPGSWTSKAPMQVARSSLGVAVVNEKIYAMGGFVENGVVTGTNEEYNPASDTWTFKTPMPTPRGGFAIAVCQNKIYCIGGYANGSSTGINEVYDLVTDSWESKASMPTARWALQANVVNGKIYLIGGYVPDDSAFGHSISALNEVYDPATDSWITKTPMPTATSSSASVAVDNKIYVTGGIGPEQPGSGLNQIYDAATDKWSQGATPLWGIGYGAAGATTGVNALKRIYFVSGNGTQVYDPMNDKWTFGDTMPTSRLSLAVAVVNDRLYAIGGITVKYVGFERQAATGEMYEDTFYATNEQYTPFGYGTPDPSYDGTAPEIVVASPENKTYYTVDVALNFTVNEPVSFMRYELDGETAVEVSGNTTLSGLSYGAHNLTVYAVDVAGNTGASETICFTIAKEPEPFPTLLVASASGVAITGAAVCVYYYRKKRNH